MQTETHPGIKRIWEQYLDAELIHLNKAVQLLGKYEGKDWQQVLPQGEFPAPLKFAPQIDYIRKVIANTVELTATGEEYSPVCELSSDTPFFHYQAQVNGDDVRKVPSHDVIAEYQRRFGQDYRYQQYEHPVPELRDRTVDNTELGRTPCCVPAEQR